MRVRKSYGIACVRYNLHRKCLEILLVRKRNTYAFIDFVLGNYNYKSVHNVQNIFDNMSNQEKLEVYSFDFARIWRFAFISDPVRNNDHRIFNNSLAKFNNMIKHHGNLKKIIESSIGRETLWEIPKGRKKFSNESKLECAIRELWEEAAIDPREYHIISTESIYDEKNTNKTKYCSEIFIALKTTDVEDFSINKTRRNYSTARALDVGTRDQITEVIAIEWKSLAEIHNNEVHATARRIFKIINAQYKISKMTHINLLLGPRNR